VAPFKTCHTAAMCFSATASFVAGGGLSAAGVATLRQAKTRSRVPLALMPLFFGIQQIVEGVVWVSTGILWLQSAAAFLYVMFSHVLWPAYVPFAVMSLEKPGRRKSALKWFLVLGSAISIWLLFYIVQAPVTATLTANGIIYNMNVPAVPYGLAAYIFVTTFSCFLSSHKFVRVLGFALIGALAISLWSYQEAFYSVWCFFAAILSLIIYVHLTSVRADVKELVDKASTALSDQIEKRGK